MKLSKRQLNKLQRSKDFRKFMKRRKSRSSGLLILLLLALILYLIFTGANIFIVIALTFLLIILMR